MAIASKLLQVLIKTNLSAPAKAVEVVAGAGDKGAQVVIRAQGDAKYQLQDLSKQGLGPDVIKAKRLGQNLLITFEGGIEPDLVIEEYYSQTVDTAEGLIGQVSNGGMHHYLVENHELYANLGQLAEGTQAVNAVLAQNQMLAAIVPSVGASNLAGVAVNALGAGTLGAAPLTALGVLGTATVTEMQNDGNVASNANPETDTGETDAAKEQAQREVAALVQVAAAAGQELSLAQTDFDQAEQALAAAVAALGATATPAQLAAVEAAQAALTAAAAALATAVTNAQTAVDAANAAAAAAKETAPDFAKLNAAIGAATTDVQGAPATTAASEAATDGQVAARQKAAMDAAISLGDAQAVCDAAEVTLANALTQLSEPATAAQLAAVEAAQNALTAAAAALDTAANNAQQAVEAALAAAAAANETAPNLASVSAEIATAKADVLAAPATTAASEAITDAHVQTWAANAQSAATAATQATTAANEAAAALAQAVAALGEPATAEQMAAVESLQTALAAAAAVAATKAAEAAALAQGASAAATAAAETVPASVAAAASAAALAHTAATQNVAPTLLAVTQPEALDELQDASAQKMGVISGSLSVTDLDLNSADGVSQLSAATSAATLTWSAGATLPAGVNVAALVASGALSFTGTPASDGKTSTITWTYDPAAVNLDWMHKADTLTIEYPITVSDGTQTSNAGKLVITINGSWDTATLSGDFVNAINEDVVTAVGGQLSVADLDAGHATFQAPAADALKGTYGNFSFDAVNGEWTYTLDNSRPVVQALVKDQTVTDTVRIESFDGSAWQDLVVTITGKNDTAAITGTATGVATEDSATADSGTLTVADVDTGEAVFQVPASLAGIYGTFNFDETTGDWGYALDSTKATVQALPAGTQVTDTLTVVSYDSTDTQDIVVTITGTNDAAEITGTATGVSTEDSATAASGTLTLTDVDTGEAVFQVPASLAGTYGTFTFNEITGVWGYALDSTKASVQALPAGTQVTDTLTVASKDGTDTQAIVVTITGINDTAAITGTATGVATEDSAAAASGTLTVADVDTGEAVFQAPASLTGTYGTFTFNETTGVWGYALDSTKASVQALPAGTQVTDKLTVASKDGTASQDIVVTITGTNDTAAITGTATGVATEDSATAANGTLTVADLDTGEAVFQVPASLAGTYGTFTFNETTGVWGYALDSTKASVQALPAGTQVTDKLTVVSKDGTDTQDIVVTITGTNDTAAITGTATGVATEDSATAANGTLTVADVDTGEAVFQAPASLAGTYGTFTFNETTGVWGYALDSTKASVQALPAGTQVTDKLTVVSKDSTDTQDIVVTITGTNDTAVITGTATGVATEDSATADSGTLTLTDVDTGEAVFQVPASLAGTYGTFTFNETTGVWGYALDSTKASVQALSATAQVTDKLTVVSKDGTASQDIVVTITGTNDTAAITGTATGVATEDSATAASGTVTVADVDTGEAVFQVPASLTGTYGTFTFNETTGVWGYALDSTKASVQALPAGTQVTDKLTVASKDGTDTQDIVVTITGTNDAAEITGTATGVATEDSATAASGTLTVTDVDTGEAVFQVPASLAGTYGTFTFNETTGVWGYALDSTKASVQALPAGTQVTDKLTVVSKDGTDTQDIVVTITGTNDAPTLSTTSAAKFTSGDEPQAINGVVTLADVDSATMASATVSITTGFVSGEDVLSLNNVGNADIGNIVASYVAATGELNMTSAGGTATQAQWQAALRAVAYSNGGETTTVGERTVSYAINDGLDTSAPLTSTINVKAGPEQTVSFSSMTKDSGVAGSNVDWLTNDGSAGRLVSGTLSAPLEEGQTLQVFVDGDLVEAAVSGTNWQITDTKGYSGNWTYTAYVVDAKGRTGPEASRVVTHDVTAEAAPVITAVTDSALAAIADDGTTNNSLKRVSGTGVTGNTIYLYDNTVTNLVGTATVVNGEWSVSVSGLFNVAGGSNAFSAVQMDAAGNTSVMSNLWTVNAGANLVPNGDFSSNTNFTSSLSLLNGAVNPFTGVGPAGYYLYPVPPAPDGSTVQPLTTSATSTGTAENGSGLSWSTKTLTILRDANLSTQDSNNYAATKASVMGTDTAMAVTVRGDQNLGLITVYQVPTNTVAVEAGKTYQFSFNYEVNPWRTKTLTAVVDGVEMKVTGYEGPLNYFTMGTMKATYTATETKTIDIQFLVNNNGATGGVGGELWLDDISFKLATTPADGSLVAGEHMGGTPAVDNLSYGGGFVNAQGGDDVITVTGTDLRTRLLAGGLIQGGEGYDTLVLAAGTSLDMMYLRAVQTVETLQQLEAITLQGDSNLTLNANEVLSLGGEVVGGKVRLVINKTSTDQVTLDNLDLNPGHEGTWVSSGTTTLNGYAYNVLNHSTTQAQVLLQTNAAPVLLTGSTLAYTENDAAKVINSAITLADVDNATFASATVSITGGYVAGQDVLSFTNVSMGNIVGSYANGVMTLTSENGTATQAQWQAALQAVAYSNTSDATSTAARTVSYVINDGQLDSTPVTSTVNLTTLNDAPVIDVATTVNLNSVLKDAAAPLNGNTTAGTLVGTLLGAITDPDGDVPKGILVTGAGAGYQSLYFSTNGGTTWIQLTNLTTSNAVFLDANSRIFYKPVAGTTGFRDGAVWYRAWDITDGVTAGTFINLTTASTGGSSSISDSSVYGAMGVNIITNTLPTGSVSITGTLEQGSTLTATNSLADVNGLGPIAYSWFVNGVSTGIVGDAYVLAAGDAGKAITVKASYTDLQGTQESMLSAPVEFVTAGQAVVNLGASYGTLTLPNQIDGRWYYYWNSASGNGGWDRGYNNFVEGLFNEDVNGNVKPAGIEGPNDIYRYATINGVRLALPTAGIQTDENGYVQAGGLNNAGTAVNSGATYNSKYSDMLAVWDAYNGTETDTVNWATAHPSTANNVRYYWTATPVSVTGTPNGQHVMLDFLTGDAASRADNLIFNVMVEVLSPQAGLAMPVITLANSKGKLINPVEVEGKWYYSWDRNGDGVLTGYNYDPDYFDAGELNTLFNKDIFGNTNTVGADMNEVFRYTTLKDANGADVWMAVPTYGGMVNANGYANVVDWQNQQANVGANTSVNAYGTINTVYDDFAAIFDAGGVPPLGWTNTYYKTSSVFMVNGAVRADQHLGYLNGDFYAITDSGSNSGAFALEMVKPNLAPVLADTALSFGTASASSLPVGAVGVLVSDLMGGVTDGDAGDAKGVAIIDIQYGGTLWYSTNGGANWLMSKDVTAQKALLLGADADNRIFFQPGKNMTGTVNDAITFRAWDRSRGEEGQFLGNNTTVNGGASPFSAATDTLSVNVGTPPVVLDLNRDGSLSYSHVAMDVNGDGRLDHTAWAGAQDGVLVWDKNGDGVVRDASQYAFTQYGGQTDLQGLAAGFDSNHDGVFDAADAKFAEFTVWQDANQNGVSEAGEVRSLADVGVARIDLSSDGVQRSPADGVSEAGRTTAITTDGTSMLVADAAFAFSALSYRVSAEGDLSLLGEQMSLDLSSLVAAHGALHSVDLSGTGANSLKISLSDLMSLGEQQPLRVLGDADDSVVLDAAQWTASGSAQAEGHSYAVYAASNGQQLWLDQQIHMA